MLLPSFLHWACHPQLCLMFSYSNPQRQQPLHRSCKPPKPSTLAHPHRNAITSATAGCAVELPVDSCNWTPQFDLTPNPTPTRPHTPPHPEAHLLHAYLHCGGSPVTQEVCRVHPGLNDAANLIALIQRLAHHLPPKGACASHH